MKYYNIIGPKYWGVPMIVSDIWMRACILNKERFTCIIAHRIAMSDNTSKYLFIQYTFRHSYLRNKHGDPSIFLAQWYCSTSLVMLWSFQQNLITFVSLYSATLNSLLRTRDFLWGSDVQYHPLCHSKQIVECLLLKSHRHANFLSHIWKEDDKVCTSR